MKWILFFPLFLGFTSLAQPAGFPQSWAGNWKGELHWYAGASRESRKVNMELRIQPGSSPGTYSWQMIYGSPTEDNRPYTLMARDTARGHWAIDEHNGIVLDQFWIAGRLSGAFTVMNSTIVNSYWLDEDKLHVEFYTLSAKAMASTGRGDKDSPLVDSYQVKGYQKAVLVRQ